MDSKNEEKTERKDVYKRQAVRLSGFDGLDLCGGNDFQHDGPCGTGKRLGPHRAGNDEPVTR